MKKTIMTLLIIALVMLIGHTGICMAQTGDLPKDDWPTVGIEAAIEVSLAYPDLQARPVTERTNLILRIAGTRNEDGKTVYDLRYIGLIPGTFKLDNYMVTPLGQKPDGLPSIPVTIQPLLPEDHEGDLISRQLRGITLPGGYRVFFVMVWVVWALLLIPIIIIIARPKKQKMERVEEVHQPTLAELLRPLVEHALDGRLDTSGKARLERLLMNYWCEKLGLDETQVLASLEKIKAHPDAGVILRELECWLHQPPGRSKVDVVSLLSPYRHIYIEERGMEGTV